MTLVSDLVHGEEDTPTIQHIGDTSKPAKEKKEQNVPLTSWSHYSEVPNKHH